MTVFSETNEALFGSEINRVRINGRSRFGGFSEIMRVNRLELPPCFHHRKSSMTRNKVEMTVGMNRGGCALPAEPFYSFTIDRFSIRRIDRSENSSGPD